MASKFARILLATLVGVALSGITACDQPGPTEQTEVEMEDTIEEAGGAVAAPPAEAVEAVEEEAIVGEGAEPEE
jgi:hypothetical protein